MHAIDLFFDSPIDPFPQQTNTHSRPGQRARHHPRICPPPVRVCVHMCTCIVRPESIHRTTHTPHPSTHPIYHPYPNPHPNHHHPTKQLHARRRGPPPLRAHARGPPVRRARRAGQRGAPPPPPGACACMLFVVLCPFFSGVCGCVLGLLCFTLCLFFGGGCRIVSFSVVLCLPAPLLLLLAAPSTAGRSTDRPTDRPSISSSPTPQPLLKTTTPYTHTPLHTSDVHPRRRPPHSAPHRGPLVPHLRRQARRHRVVPPPRSLPPPASP